MPITWHVHFRGRLKYVPFRAKNFNYFKNITINQKIFIIHFLKVVKEFKQLLYSDDSDVVDVASLPDVTISYCIYSSVFIVIVNGRDVFYV